MNAKGFTLIELMITLAIGLVILGGAGAMYYGIYRSYLMQTALSRVEDEGRFAMQYMSYIIRMAGYRQTTVMGRDAFGLAFTTAENGPVMEVRMDGPFDCSGNPVKFDPEASLDLDYMTQEPYYLYAYQFQQDSNSKSLQRTCNDDNQPIAGKKDSLYGAQIEDLQFRVGIDQDGDASVDRYDKASTIDWTKAEEALTVRSVQICLEISSSDPVFHDRSLTKPYVPCKTWASGDATENAPDYCKDRYCQVFHTTVFLRNRGMP